MIKGNVIGMSAYYRDGECEEEKAGMAFGAAMFKQMFEGVDRLRITKVQIDGDIGQIVDGEIEGKVSDATKRLFEDESSEDSEDDRWKWADGKWWVLCDEEGTSSASASPEDASPKGEILESGFGQSGQYVRAVALVKNLSDRGGQTVKVVVNFYDAADSLVKTETQTESFSWGGQTLAVPVFADLGQAGLKVARSEATLQVEANGVFDEGSELPTVEGTIAKAQYGDGWIAKFELSNTTAKPLEDLRVGVVCRDAAGKIIGGTSEYPELIAAGSKILTEADVTTSGKPASCTAYPSYGF